MDITADQVRTAVVSLIAFILSVAVHEFGHAWMANRLGDRLPAEQGRLTLSPLAHIDPVGTILLPLLAAFAPGGMPLLAWGKPVQTNPKAYRGISPRVGNMLVSLMGPFMNLVLAVVISILLIVLSHIVKLPADLVVGAIRYFLVLNISLMFFNLLPVPPLDGGSVLAVVLPQSLQSIPRVLQRYGMLILFALLLTGAMTVLMYPAYQVAGVWARTVLRLMNG
jgi:Zn-dependent protease